MLYGRNDEDGRESKASRPQPGLSMSARRWLVLILGVARVGGAALVWLPEVVRWVTLAQIQALRGLDIRRASQNEEAHATWRA